MVLDRKGPAEDTAGSARSLGSRIVDALPVHKAQAIVHSSDHVEELVDRAGSHRYVADRTAIGSGHSIAVAVVERHSLVVRASRSRAEERRMIVEDSWGRKDLVRVGRNLEELGYRSYQDPELANHRSCEVGIGCMGPTL